MMYKDSRIEAQSKLDCLLVNLKSLISIERQTPAEEHHEGECNADI